MNAWIILAIGFLAQIFFAARTLVQWIMSERARKVLSPSLFWILSIAGAYLLCIYGWLRDDFAIVLGQMISYYIYLWNLKMKGVWRKIRVPWRYFTLGLLVATPLVAITFVAGNAADFIDKFFRNADVPMWLLVFGSAGQVIFTLRFIYQWLYSMKKGESTLPLGCRVAHDLQLWSDPPRPGADCRPVVRIGGLYPQPHHPAGQPQQAQPDIAHGQIKARAAK